MTIDVVKVDDHADKSDGALRSMLQCTSLACKWGVVACVQFLDSEHWVWVSFRRFSSRAVPFVCSMALWLRKLWANA
jgi:hypothetical protein